MSNKDQDDAWDFTSVIDLIHSLSSKADKCTVSDTSLGSPEEPVTPEQYSDHGEGHSELGNFDKLWRYLGQPLNVPPPVVTAEPPNALKGIPNGDAELAYASVDSSASKGVRWRDEVEGADLADNDENYDPNSLPQLSKARKKKLRRQKKARATIARSNSATALAVTSSENESELEDKDVIPTRSRGSVIREILYGSRPDNTDAGAETTPSKKPSDRNVETPKWPIANPRYFLRSSVRKQETSIEAPDTSLAEAAKKKSRLIKKLHEHFILERPYLENIGLGSFTGASTLVAESGVHVFVDASNVGPITYRYIMATVAET